MTAKALKRRLAHLDTRLSELQTQKTETEAALAAAQQAERKREKCKKPSKKAPNL